MKVKSKLIIFLILIISLIQNNFGQDITKFDSKVDSVFNVFFSLIDPSDHSLTDTTNLDLVLKDSEKRIVIFDFFENISGLYLKREYKQEHEYSTEGICSYCYSSKGFTKICVVYTSLDFGKWEKWYCENKAQLIWNNDNKMIRKTDNFKYIDYKSFYPSFIRFKKNMEWIPVSTKPDYVKDFEKKMEREGYLEPRELKLETKK